MKQKKVLLGDRQRMESNTVVSHYTGEKDIDRVIRALAEKQRTVMAKIKKSRHKTAGSTGCSLICYVLCGMIKAHTDQAALT